MHKLQQEIRSRFKGFDSITSKTALQLPYLQAVINEGLRIYPPSSQGLPRTSPGAFVDGFWIPAGVRTHPVSAHVFESLSVGLGGAIYKYMDNGT